MFLIGSLRRTLYQVARPVSVVQIMTSRIMLTVDITSLQQSCGVQITIYTHVRFQLYSYLSFIYSTISYLCTVVYHTCSLKGYLFFTSGYLWLVMQYLKGLHQKANTKLGWPLWQTSSAARATVISGRLPARQIAHSGLFLSQGEKKFNRLPAPQNRRKSCYCITGSIPGQELTNLEQ